MEYEKIRKIISEILDMDVDEITPEASFSDDLGADSLDLFQIIMKIEEDFDIVIDMEEAEKIVTVQDAVDALQLRDHA